MPDGNAHSLETYKRSARLLKKAHALGEADALARVAVHVDGTRPVKHADFLHVAAREAGYESWPALKFALERAAMSRQERADRLKRALYHGQHWVTEKLLREEPDLKDADLGLLIALYDLKAVREVIAADPRAANRPVGRRSPILHLAFSKEIHRSPEKAHDMLALADLLAANGADVNDGYVAEPGGRHKLSALYGALCHAGNFELGRWFLAKGADPNDNESLYHSTELGNAKALEALLKHGARPDGTNALPRALDFDNEEMVRLLLEAGADPNTVEPDHPGGQPANTIPALHQAARRGASVSCVELLLNHGADPAMVWDGHTPYAMALIYGNLPAAKYLADRGHAAPLSENERILAACARGAETTARLAPDKLSEEDRSLLTRLAFIPGKLDHMKALVAAGLDPEVPDAMGLPPLHVAGWHGLVQELAYFLSLGPDLTRKNNFGGDALDTVVHGSEFAPRRLEADHVSCARLLLEAGSVLYESFVTGCGNEDMAAFLEDWRDTHR